MVLTHRHMLYTATFLSYFFNLLIYIFIYLFFHETCHVLYSYFLLYFVLYGSHIQAHLNTNSCACSLWYVGKHALIPLPCIEVLDGCHAGDSISMLKNALLLIPVDFILFLVLLFYACWKQYIIHSSSTLFNKFSPQ
jgi:hypothetical protein